MQNLRSRFLYPALQDKFAAGSFDTWLPVNTYSGKVLQIRQNKRASLYYYDTTTRESALVSGEMSMVHDPQTKASFWQSDWESMFPGNIKGEEYALAFFKANRFKYYNGLGEAYENDVPSR